MRTSPPSRGRRTAFFLSYRDDVKPQAAPSFELQRRSACRTFLSVFQFAFSGALMDSTLRFRLSLMMFLQYFIWGAWGVVIFTYIGASPADGGLAFSGSFQGWINATMPIGAMISP